MNELAHSTILRPKGRGIKPQGIQLKDETGSNLIGDENTVTVFANSGILSPVTNNTNGIYTTTLTANDNVTAITITAKVNGLNIADSARISVKVSATTPSSALAKLGEAIFKDTNLSNPPGQSCGTCHDIDSEGSHDTRINNATSEGANSLFGGRNTPTISYTAQIPDQFLSGLNPVGGQFWDGRAISLEEQARQPFLDSLEMNNPDKTTVINKIKAASYANDFKAIFGDNSLENSELAFIQMSEAIASFERTRLFSPFTSKWDAVQAGTEIFTISEQAGLDVFLREGCALCHLTPDNLLGTQMFSNFQYENPGTPINTSHPFLTNINHPSFNQNFMDLGLGSAPANIEDGPHTGNQQGKGLFRVPTLRNVAKTSPYMHNGVFDTLEEVINFYNGENIPGKSTAEFPDSIFERYESAFSSQEKIDLKRFLETLSDR